jgi:hypothetical protein
MMAKSMTGSLKKILMAPHCVRTIRPTRCSTPDVQPETGKRSAGSVNAAERHLNSVGTPSTRLACNQIDEEPNICRRSAGMNSAPAPSGHRVSRIRRIADDARRIVRP